jgi:hypothetical protein
MDNYNDYRYYLPNNIVVKSENEIVRARSKVTVKTDDYATVSQEGYEQWRKLCQTVKGVKYKHQHRKKIILEKYYNFVRVRKCFITY